MTGGPPPQIEPTGVPPSPRAVPVRRALAWYEEAMRLWKRAPATWAALAFVTVAVELATDRLPGAASLVGKLVTPLVAAGMIVAALAADRNAPVRITHAFAAFAAPAGAMAAIIVSSAVTLAGEAAAAWWIADTNLLASDFDASSLTFVEILGVYSAGVLVSLPFTFVPFHVLLEHAGVRAAFAASFRGFALNTLPLVVYGAQSLLLLTIGIVSYGIGLMIALPLIVAATYAAWKDVFGPRLDAPPPDA